MVKGPAIIEGYGRPIGASRRRLPLLEAGMIAAIVTLMGGGGYVYFSSASSAQQTAEVAKELAVTQDVVRKAYAQSPNYAALTTSEIVERVPAKMRRGASGLKHAFGGEMTVQPQNVGGGVGSGFSIHMASLPQSACQKLATENVGRKAAAMFINDKAIALPINRDDARRACDTETDAMSFYFF